MVRLSLLFGVVVVFRESITAVWTEQSLFIFVIIWYTVEESLTMKKSSMSSLQNRTERQISGVLRLHSVKVEIDYKFMGISYWKAERSSIGIGKKFLF